MDTYQLMSLSGDNTAPFILVILVWVTSSSVGMIAQKTEPFSGKAAKELCMGTAQKLLACYYL